MIAMQKSEVIERVNTLLTEELEIDPETIRPDASLIDDLGIDSLDFVDIAVLVESNFGFSIKAEDLINVNTISEFYDFIETKV
jgi:acyl carrier protein